MLAFPYRTTPKWMPCAIVYCMGGLITAFAHLWRGPRPLPSTHERQGKWLIAARQPLFNEIGGWVIVLDGTSYRVIALVKPPSQRPLLLQLG